LLQNASVSKLTDTSLELSDTRMGSPDAASATGAFSLTRQIVRTTLAFPFLPLLVIAALARSPEAPAHSVSIAAFLLGAAVLLTARSAVAAMRAMEQEQPSSVTNGMRLKIRVNAGVGALMVVFSVWRETLG
jgi:hypothetical protein